MYKIWNEKVLFFTITPSILDHFLPRDYAILSSFFLILQFSRSKVCRRQLHSHSLCNQSLGSSCWCLWPSARRFQICKRDDVILVNVNVFQGISYTRNCFKFHQFSSNNPKHKRNLGCLLHQNFFRWIILSLSPSLSLWYIRNSQLVQSIEHNYKVWC